MFKWTLSLLLLLSSCGWIETPEVHIKELGFGQGAFLDNDDFFSFRVIDTMPNVFFAPHRTIGGKYKLSTSSKDQVLVSVYFTHPSDSGEIKEGYSVFYSDGDTFQGSYYLMPEDSAYIGHWTMDVVVIDSLIYQKSFEMK